METKQVIVIRKDLNMRKGKMVAQGCHASMKAVLNSMYYTKYSDNYTTIGVSVHHDGPLYQWLNDIFTKIVVGCDSEEELLSLHATAKIYKVDNALIQDSGLTEFHGVPTYTALAIGPDEVSKIDKITSHLKLL